MADNDNTADEATRKLQIIICMTKAFPILRFQRPTVMVVPMGDGTGAVTFEYVLFERGTETDCSRFDLWNRGKRLSPDPDGPQPRGIRLFRADTASFDDCDRLMDYQARIWGILAPTFASMADSDTFEYLDGWIRVAVFRERDSTTGRWRYGYNTDPAWMGSEDGTSRSLRRIFLDV